MEKIRVFWKHHYTGVYLVDSKDGQIYLRVDINSLSLTEVIYEWRDVKFFGWEGMKNHIESCYKQRYDFQD